MIVAAYDGVCGLCGGEIRADEDEIVCVDDEWCHADCAEDDGEVIER